MLCGPLAAETSLESRIAKFTVVDMQRSRINLKTDEGVMDCYVSAPPGPGQWPAIIFYFDAFGMRPDAFAMADRLAAEGYAVAMPNLFYRTGPFTPFSAATAFTDPEERKRLYALIASIDNAKVMRDTGHLIEVLPTSDAVAGAKLGCVGYCLGGQFALSAAGCFPNLIAAAASVHGTALATPKPDSPHLLFPKARGRIYVALAEHDAEFSPQEAHLLKDALAAAKLDHEIETYPGTRHGFAVIGRKVYDEAAAERHLRKLIVMFSETLKA